MSMCEHLFSLFKLPMLRPSIHRVIHTTELRFKLGCLLINHMASSLATWSDVFSMYGPVRLVPPNPCFRLLSTRVLLLCSRTNHGANSLGPFQNFFSSLCGAGMNASTSLPSRATRPRLPTSQPNMPPPRAPARNHRHRETARQGPAIAVYCTGYTRLPPSAVARGGSA